LIAGQSLKKINKILLGLSMVFVSLIVGALFFLRGYQNVYWSLPVSFIIVTVAGVFFALYGSFLVGNNLLATGGSRGPINVFLSVSGGIIGLCGGLLGLAAIGLAIAISLTGYWGSAPYSYTGDYLIMGWQILALRLSIVLGIIGGFSVGLSCRRRRSGYTQ
jgi:hypothetical protein